jgi:hypothetical protein
MHTKEEIPNMAFTHFLALLDFLVEKDARDLAVELVYDYYGHHVMAKDFDLCDAVIKYFVIWGKGKSPGWLAMPFLTISKPYDKITRYDELFDFALKKWKDEMKPEHVDSAVNRLKRNKPTTFLDEVEFTLLEPNGFRVNKETKIDGETFSPYKEITHPDFRNKVFRYTPEYAQDLNGPQGRVDMMPELKKDLEEAFGFELTQRAE